MLIWSSPDLRPHPLHMLRHYALGAFPCYLTDDTSGPVGWTKYSHRGVHRPEKIHVGERQKRYIFNKRFDFRCNTAFEQVVRQCADLSRCGYTWLTEELIGCFGKLHHMGFAHSFEAWENDQLVGGTFGVQLGAMMTLESIFHRADHAGKAAYGRALLHLRERGIRLIDVNFVTEDGARWGAQWMPQWQFEQELRRLIHQRISIVDGRPAPPLPWPVRMRLPWAIASSSLGRRLRRVVGLKERQGGLSPSPSGRGSG